MSQNIAVTQLAQLGLAERFAQEAQGHPEVLREAARQTTPEALKQLRESVEKTENAAKSPKVKTEKDGGGKSRDENGKRKRKKAPGAGSAARSAPDSPWAGNLLNLTV